MEFPKPFLIFVLNYSASDSSAASTAASKAVVAVSPSAAAATAAAAAPAWRGDERAAPTAPPASSSPECRARPGVRDSAVSADSRRLPLPPPGDRPNPGFRAASPVSLTLARCSGSPALRIYCHLCILHRSLKSYSVTYFILVWTSALQKSSPLGDTNHSF